MHLRRFMAVKAPLAGRLHGLFSLEMDSIPVATKPGKVSPGLEVRLRKQRERRCQKVES